MALLSWPDFFGWVIEGAEVAEELFLLGGQAAGAVFLALRVQPCA